MQPAMITQNVYTKDVCYPRGPCSKVETETEYMRIVVHLVNEIDNKSGSLTYWPSKYNHISETYWNTSNFSFWHNTV
jgi:hypothetical protein